MFKRFCLLAALCSLLFAAGCSMKKLLADSMVPTLEDTSEKFFAEKSVPHAREAAPGLLKVLDGVIAGSPYNYDLLLLGAKLNAGFAMGFMEDEDPERAKVLYQKGFQYSLRAFDDEELDAAVTKNSEAVEKVLDNYGSSWAPWMFWAGNCLGSEINLRRDETGAIGRLSMAKAFVERVIELDRGDYYYGGSYVVLGIYWGSRSKLGGSSPKSREYFKKALEVSDGKFLLYRVLCAKYYAVYADCLKCHNKKARAKICPQCEGRGKIGNALCTKCEGYEKLYCSRCRGTGQELKTFENQLQYVLDAPDDILPQEYLANQLAKRKAKKLLEKRESLFNIPKKPSEDPLQKDLSKEEEKKKAAEDKAIFEEYND